MADLVVMSASATDEEVERVVARITRMGFDVHLSRGREKTLIGIIGDTRQVNDEIFATMPGVLEVISILKEYKIASREFHPDDTVFEVEGLRIGGKEVCLIAGPCSIESKELLRETARHVRQAGANILRGGAFKPRTSPYAFLGLELEGLRILQEVKEEIGIPVVTEVLSPEEVEPVAKVADIVQVGARNMFNYRLLQRLGRCEKPVLLKRGFEAKLSELLASAEYVLKGGNSRVILCERGIRTFDDKFSRNTLDLSAVPILKRETHLPVFVDPSHGTGRRALVIPMARAALAAGADGIMVEVHPSPEEALSDGFQSLNLEEFDRLVKELRPLAALVGRTL